MPDDSRASRASMFGQIDRPRSRLRPSPRSSNHRYSMFTMSGAPSNSKVWMMNSLSRTLWNTPLKPERPPVGFVHIAGAAAAFEVPVLDRHLQVMRPQPLLDQLGLGVRQEQGIHRCVEVAGELHGQGVDRGVEVERIRHFSVPSLWVSVIAASR